MCIAITRRQMLQWSAATAVAGAVSQLPAQVRRPGAALAIGGQLIPFRLQDVRLLDGDFKRSADINERYLDTLQVDRLLHTFRLTSGITSTATSRRWALRRRWPGGCRLSSAASETTSGSLCCAWNTAA